MDGLRICYICKKPQTYIVVSSVKQMAKDGNDKEFSMSNTLLALSIQQAMCTNYVTLNERPSPKNGGRWHCSENPAGALLLITREIRMSYSRS